MKIDARRAANPGGTGSASAFDGTSVGSPPCNPNRVRLKGVALKGAATPVAMFEIDDLQWGDPAWSQDDWILFVVLQKVNGCVKVRADKIRPDGSSRTQVSDGGPNCTSAGAEPSGDADPGWSSDSTTIYSSRGFPVPPANGPPGSTERKLYAFSSDAWYPGKPEMDLSLSSEPSCIEGVPKGSPDGRHVLIYRLCFDDPRFKPGIYISDTTGAYRTFVTEGFGPDWNPKVFRRRPPHRN